jgi:hypothetical protein
MRDSISARIAWREFWFAANVAEELWANTSRPSLDSASILTVWIDTTAINVDNRSQWKRFVQWTSSGILNASLAASVDPSWVLNSSPAMDNPTVGTAKATHNCFALHADRESVDNTSHSKARVSTTTASSAPTVTTL